MRLAAPLLPILLLATVGACAIGTTEDTRADVEAVSLAARATFDNPVFAEDCADPGVVRVGDGGGASFFMVCTGGGFAIRRSEDLVSWRDTGASIFPSGKPPWANNGERNWAPEIHVLGPRAFVAYYTAADADDRLAIGVAHATAPTGPWIDEGHPLIRHPIGVIDPTFFADDDGQQYLYWKVDGNQRGEPTPILVRPLAADGRSFVPSTRAREVLRNDPASFEGGVVEAPSLVRKGGLYYLFYSANVYDGRYVTGVARARSPFGPFEKEDRPLLESNDRWLGPGHGSVVRTGGEDWFVHHAWPATGTGEINEKAGRWVLLDRVRWSDGWPRFRYRSSTIGPQRAPAIPR
jgi:arabinan endo-1,5-alpha-L-arabinosidase